MGVCVWMGLVNCFACGQVRIVVVMAKNAVSAIELGRPRFNKYIIRRPPNSTRSMRDRREDAMVKPKARSSLEAEVPVQSSWLYFSYVQRIITVIYSSSRAGSCLEHTWAMDETNGRAWAIHNGLVGRPA